MVHLKLNFFPAVANVNYIFIFSLSTNSQSLKFIMVSVHLVIREPARLSLVKTMNIVERIRNSIVICIVVHATVFNKNKELKKNVKKNRA